MGHHTKKHRKRTSRRGKYQKISPKKTRRRRQTKRRGGACCSGRPSKSRGSKIQSSRSRVTRPSGTPGKSAELAVSIMYGDSTRRSGTQDDFVMLSNDKKLEFCRVVIKDKIFAKNAGEGAKGASLQKLNLDIKMIGELMNQLGQ